MGNRYCYKTFETWCLENNRQDILDLWDDDLNDVTPADIPAGTKKRYYFKCPEGIHESESKRILTITDKPTHTIICSQCNSGVAGNPLEDLSGKMYGELLVLDFDEEKTREKHNTYWHCQCSCGNKVSVLATKLKGGDKLTCGGKSAHIIIPDSLSYNEELQWYKPDDPKYIRHLRRSGMYYQYKKDVIAKDGGKCIVCGSTNHIEVHHIYPFATHFDKRFDVDCGVCVCKNHHNSSVVNSYHNKYGMKNNTPEQFESYVNMERCKIGINEHFDVFEYMTNIESDYLDIDEYTLDL